MKKSLLGVRLRSRVLRDTEAGAGGGGAAGDGSGDAGGDDDAGDDDSDDDGDGEEGKGKDKDGKDSEKSKTVPESKYLQIKRQLSEADRKKQEALDELKQLKLKDLPDAEKQAEELKDALESASTYKNKFENMARTNAFLTASGDLKVSWKSATAALKLAELDDLQINDDGTVEGIKDAVKALAKDHPYLVSTTTEDDSNGKGPTKSGSVVGSNQGKGKKPAGTLSDEELRRRFPSLY